MKRLVRSPLLPIFLIVFVGLLGFGIIIPLLPLYAKQFGASPFVAGLLLSTYSLLQLVATPYLGALSDRIGRRPVLIVSQIGTVLSFLLLGVANSLPLLFVARVLDGISGGNISTAQAYISDVVDEKNRAKAFGLIGVAFGLGFILGPVIGGVLSHGGNFYRPALAAATISFVSLLLTIFYLPESLPRAQRNQRRQLRIFDVAGLRRAWGYEQLGLLLLIFFLFSLVQAGFEGLFTLFSDRKFGLGPRESGYLLGYVGVLGVLVQGGMLGPLVQRLGERRVLQAGLVLGAFGFVWSGFADSLPILMLALVPVAFGLGVATPTTNSLIARESPPDERGRILGIGQSMSALARVFGPLLSGYALEYQTWLPFVVAALLSLGAWTLAVRLVPPSRPSEDPRFRKRTHSTVAQEERSTYP
jgi:DHA1 family tetracycline resistance protein-like MFS transporter